MEISFSFFIRVDENGNQTPMMVFFPPRYEMLSHLAFGHLSSSSGVRKEIDNIYSVLSTSQNYSFAGDDWCIIDVKDNSCIVSNGFDEYEPFELNTEFILKVLNEWEIFLQRYESGGIQGLSR